MSFIDPAIAPNHRDRDDAPGESQLRSVLQASGRCSMFSSQSSLADRSAPPHYQASSDYASDLNLLPDLLQWLEWTSRSLLPPWKAKVMQWECQLIVTEGFTNAIRHAHAGLVDRDRSSLSVRIEVIQWPDLLELRVWDSGPGFAFDQALATVLAHPPDPLEGESGRGLLFMSRLADELTYQRWGQQNCLIAYKGSQPRSPQRSKAR